MARHAAPRARTAWRPVAVAAAAGVALLSTGTGVYALLQATATGTQSATTGSLSLTLAGNGTFGTAITDAAPGDNVSRYVTLTNGGTLPASGLTVSASATGSSDLTGTGTSALQVSVSTCTGTWTPATGACSGTVATPVSGVALGSLATARDVVTGAVSPGTVHRLRITLVVPDNGEVTTNGTPPPTTVQGRTAGITFTFSEAQRAATTSSS